MSKRVINSQRFDWKGATREAYAVELLRRNIKRLTTKDSVLPCGVCGARHIVRHNWVYYPAAGTSANNEVLGHADCVERVAGGGSPSLRVVRSASGSAAKTLSKPLTNGQPVLKGDVGREYFAGWAAGVRLAFDKEQPTVTAAPEYLRGLSDGVAWAAEHGAG